MEGAVALKILQIIAEGAIDCFSAHKLKNVVLVPLTKETTKHP